MPTAFIVRVARTAAGKRNGALSHYHPAVLGAKVVDGGILRRDRGFERVEAGRYAKGRASAPPPVSTSADHAAQQASAAAASVPTQPSATSARTPASQGRAQRPVATASTRARHAANRRLARVASAQPEVLLARLPQTSQRHARLRLRRQGFE